MGEEIRVSGVDRPPRSPERMDHLYQAVLLQRRARNKPYELDLMLRNYMLQKLYDLSDMATVAEVIDSCAFSEFCGVDSSNPVPDGETQGRFRRLLEENGIQQKLFVQVVRTLMNMGLILKRETIVDSTIIAAPSSTKNRKKERDPDAHSVKTGNAWHFGYRAHVGVDKESGQAHTVEVTGANTHDVTVMSKLLTGEEETVYGDSGYLGAEKRKNATTRNTAGKNIKYKINCRPSQSKNRSTRFKAKLNAGNTRSHPLRAKDEHIFATVKGQLRYRKTRYRGLRKTDGKTVYVVCSGKHCSG